MTWDKRLNQAFVTVHLFPFTLSFSGFAKEIGMRKSNKEQISRVWRDKLGLLARRNYFENVALIRFEKIYLIFMSVCFKLFDATHGFSKIAALVRNHVAWINLTMYRSMYDSNQFVFIQIKRVSEWWRAIVKKILLFIFWKKMQCRISFNKHQALYKRRHLISTTRLSIHIIREVSPLIRVAPLNAVLVRVVTILVVAKPKCMWK